MASQNIARLGVVLGLDTAEFTASIDKAISENAKLKNAIKRDTNAAASELKSLIHAADDYGKALTKVELIQREVTSGKYMNATADMKKRLLDQAAAYDKVAASQAKVIAGGFKMNEQQKLQLTYQTTDLFTQIASGQSPFIALIQQGGQLKDSMGGLGNMFKSLGTLFTPFSVGLGSIAIVAGSVGYAFYKAKDELDKFKDAMTLTGGYAGATYDKFLSLGNVLSDKTNASIGDARELMQQLAASGKFTAASMQSVGEVILRFAKISGVDAKEAAKSLIPLLDGTASSAKNLNEKYHFLTIEQYKNIEALEKQGKLQEAAKVTAQLLNDSLQSTQRNLGTLEKAWESIKNMASSAWDAMLGWGRESSMDRAKELEKKINQAVLNLEESKKSFASGDFSAKEANIARMRAELEQIVAKETAAMDAVEARSKQAEEDQRKINDYSGAGGAAKSKEIALAIAKAEAEVRYQQAIVTAGEIQKIEMEAQKKKDEKIAEFNKKSEQERRAFGGMLAKQQAAELLAIELETQAKIKAVRDKRYIDELAQRKEDEDEFNAEYVRRSQARISADMSALSRTKEIDFQRESLELKYQMIYATETEQKLAQVSLEYARKRKELEQSENKSQYQFEQLERQEAMAKMFVTMEESGKRTQQVFDSVFGNMSSAIDNFVKNGKLSMKDLTRSIIQDLIAIQLKASMLTMLKGIFGGNPFTPGSNSFVGPMQYDPLNLGKKASGGSVTNNTPYIVGERGPELFVPSGSGTIIPNGQIGNMGGTTNVTNYYIDAIDTKSFEDRVLNSSNAVWAANQYAGKSLAITRGRA